MLTIEERKIMNDFKQKWKSLDDFKNFLYQKRQDDFLNWFKQTEEKAKSMDLKKNFESKNSIKNDKVADRKWWDFWVNVFEQFSKFWDKIKFKSEKDDGFLMSGAKFIWNIPWNALGLVWWIWWAVSNPVWTVESVADFWASAIETGMNKLSSTETWQNLIRWWREKVWNSAWTEEVLEKIKKGWFYSSEKRQAIWEWIKKFTNEAIENPLNTAKKIVVENPIDILTLWTWAAAWAWGKANKIAKLADTAWDLKKAEKFTKIANIADKTSDILNPINVTKNIYIKPAEKILKWTWSTLKTLTSKVSWLNPETLNNLVKNPELFRKAEKGFLTKENVAEKVVKSIDQRIAEVWELWKKYENIKSSIWKIDTTKIIPRKILEKYDIKATSKWLDFSSSAIWDTWNMNAITKAFDIIKTRKLENWKDILNLRRALDDVINYKSEATDLAKNIVRELRTNIDKVAKEQIPELNLLDKKFGSEIWELQKIKKYIFSADGTLKDNYIQKISNLTWKWKEKTLERIKKLVPEIEHEINALKALADVNLASWNKVWTYMQTFSWIAWFSAWGIWWAIAWAIITNPNSIKNILLHYGAGKNYISNVMNKVKNGIKLSSSESWTLSKILNSEIIADKIKNFWKDFVPKSNFTNSQNFKNLEKQIKELENFRVVKKEWFWSKFKTLENIKWVWVNKKYLDNMKNLFYGKKNQVEVWKISLDNWKNAIINFENWYLNEIIKKHWKFNLKNFLITANNPNHIIKLDRNRLNLIREIEGWKNYFIVSIKEFKEWVYVINHTQILNKTDTSLKTLFNKWKIIFWWKIWQKEE